MCKYKCQTFATDLSSCCHAVSRLELSVFLNTCGPPCAKSVFNRVLRSTCTSLTPLNTCQVDGNKWS